MLERVMRVMTAIEYIESASAGSTMWRAASTKASKSPESSVSSR